MGSFKMPTKIFTGEQSITEIPSLIGQRILVICDPFMASSGKVALVTDLLDASQRSYLVFSEVVPDPTIDVVAKGVAQAVACEPDTIIALGGGSALDTAKAVRQIYTQGIEEAAVQMIAIPTTSGTGSEVTSFAVISDPANHSKFALVDDAMTPEFAILDPVFTMSVPGSVTADTGMDVLTHTLEAYVSTQATDFTDACGEKAMGIIWQDLVKVYRDVQNEALRAKVHNSSCLAGMAFSEASLGICHSLAHALGGRFHIPHGRANAILLPYVIAYNAGLNETKAQPCLTKYAQAANLLGIHGGTEKSSVTLLVAGIQRLAKQMAIPNSITEIGINEEEFMQAIPEMAQAAMKDTCTLTNPRVPTQIELEDLYRRIWRGGY